MKSELSISDFHALQTDRNRIKGSTGSLLMISCWSSKGMLSDILILMFDSSREGLQRYQLFF
ncbi:hypothetical protein Hanom_Chr16g01516861 [Helianthus anomalus]